ncbi:MAG: Ig-like domain-containing protein [Bacteroidaceae bacterium]|nr:Ig-like domain-containing protein [Bacteroidaceae bacterium]
MKRLFSIFIVFAFVFIGKTQAQYRLEYGEAQFLKIPTNEYVASATWNVDNPNLSFEEADAAGAIIYPNHYFEETSVVTCSYRYEYLDSRTGRTLTALRTATYTVSFVSNHAILKKEELFLNVNQRERLTYSLEKNYSTAYGSPRMSWTSSNRSVATVDDNGNVTAVGEGTAFITFDPVVGPEVYCYVTVKSVPDPTSIELSTNNISIVEKETATLTYTLSPSNAASTVTWQSSNSNIATVTNDGVVTGVKEGTAQITATTANGKSASCTVNVVKSVISPTRIELSVRELSVKPNGTARLSYTLYPSGSSSNVTWRSSNTGIATVSTGGVVTGVKEGTVQITVTTDNGLSASCTVKVASDASPTTEQFIIPQSETITLGYITILTPTVSSVSYQWKSSNTTVAVVDSEGRVTGMRTGKAKITVTTSDNISGTCEVTVVAPPSGMGANRAKIHIEKIKSLVNRSKK